MKSPKKHKKNLKHSETVAATPSNTEQKSHRQPQPHHRPHKTKETHQAALDLSHKLRQLSSQKRLRECLALYESPQYDTLRDVHHGSIVIDACARCGDMLEAERIANVMLGRNDNIITSTGCDAYIWEHYDRIPYKRMPIQAWTALLKGYVHAGMMAKAESLFSVLCRDAGGASMNGNSGDSKKRKRDDKKSEGRVNVRTLNTLLRGCLWSAATINDAKTRTNKQKEKGKKSKGNAAKNELVGGVVTAERAWEMFKKHVGCSFDSSSYEYFITLLCQSLQCDKAEKYLNYMKEQFNLSEVAGMSNVDQSLVESRVVCLVALSRAYAIRGKVDDCKRCTKEALKMIENLGSATSATDAFDSKKKPKRIATGGKQSWKPESNADGTLSGRREQSNMLFRSHRISELKSEATTLHNYANNHHDNMILARVMMTRLLYFSGGGTTGLNAITDINTSSVGLPDGRDIDGNSNIEHSFLQWCNSLWFSFGLKEVIRLVDQEHDISDIDIGSINHQNHALAPENCNRLRKYLLGKDYHVITPQGYIDFKRVFSPLGGSTASLLSKSTSSKDAPLHIEIGSGTGDWSTIQAEENPSESYVTVELRADRVAQSFAKTVLIDKAVNRNSTLQSANNTSMLTNLCCVGSECGSFLRDRIQPGTVRTIFCNHPEPPTQTSTDEEQAHMLNSETLMAAARCLELSGKGRIVIVTDNLIYARLLGRTMAKVLASGDAKLVGVRPNEVSDIRRIETVSANNGSFVHIFEGKPSSSIGHYTPSNSSFNGTSYFDRLWRTGAGKHAAMKKRFIIVVRTIGDHDNSATTSKTGSSSHKATSAAHTKKPNKKRSTEQQQRRNERRLLKKKKQQQLEQK
jgi:pentatricopeptide repeat protein